MSDSDLWWSPPEYEPDYEREPLQIGESKIYDVLDPWSAQIRGFFYSKADAEAFCKMIHRKSAKKKKAKK